MTRDEQLKEAWDQETYPEFMAVCEKYSLVDHELREYDDRRIKEWLRKIYLLGLKQEKENEPQ
jgi:hypothetical protein